MQKSIQEIVEEPELYMIRMCSSSLSDQLADRLECLTGLNKPVISSNNICVNDYMHCNGKEQATSGCNKADLSNTFFDSVYAGSDDLDNPPITLPTCNNINPPHVNQTSISFHEGDVYKASLDSFKAKGIDGISPLLLTKCSLALCHPLHHLFQVSVNTDNISDEWRTQLIIPMHKSGNRSYVANYRLIPCSKCFQSS